MLLSKWILLLTLASSNGNLSTVQIPFETEKLCEKARSKVFSEWQEVFAGRIYRIEPFALCLTNMDYGDADK